MPTYLTEYFASNEVGRICKMGGDIQAETMEEAMKICEEIGQTYVGELVGEVDASDMAGLCDSIQEQRDRDWLESVKRVDEH